MKGMRGWWAGGEREVSRRWAGGEQEMRWRWAVVEIQELHLCITLHLLLQTLNLSRLDLDLCKAICWRKYCQRYNRPRPLLLIGSMYFWSWLILLNMSYKYNENIARTEISTLNGHISKTMQNFDKLMVPKFSAVRFRPFLDHMGPLKWWRKKIFLHCGDELNGIDSF